MKHLSIYLSCALAAGLWSCSSDDQPKNPGTENPENSFYATLSFDFATRSTTIDPGDNPSQSSSGFEYGQDSENKVSSVIIVLASKDKTTGAYTYITDSGIVNADQVANGTDGAAGVPNPLYRVKFDTNALLDYAGQNVEVFAYCNPTETLKVALKNWNVDLIYTILEAEDEIYATNTFLMTNALEATTTLPSESQMQTIYNKPTNPANLGTVKVQRVSSRFDFAQTQITDMKTLNTYPIYEYLTDPNQQTLQGTVTLDGMALFNEAKTFYLLPRVANSNNAADGPDMNTVTLLGKETTNNWVISPTKTASDWCYGLQSEPNPSSFKYTLFSSLQTDDNPQNWDEGNKTDYKIWRYTTENTIPSISGQQHGVSTGVLFRGYITGEEGTKLAAAIGKLATIYAHDGIMYGSLEDLKEYVSKLPESSVGIAFQETFGLDLANEMEPADYAQPEKVLEYLNKNDNVQDLTATNDYFNVYQPKPEDGKYYVYYYYFNRHNDNGNNTVMGPMEFATVRNNVYKLKVTNIYQWGNPGDKPTDPENPDEEPKVYFRVQVEVLPWVVRINNIEF